MRSGILRSITLTLKVSASLENIRLNLGTQLFHALKMELGTQATDQPNAQPKAIERRSRIVEQVALQAAEVAPHGGVAAQVGDRIILSPLPLHTREVDPVRKHHLLLKGDIGGRKAQLAAQLPSGCDNAFNGKFHFCRGS